MQLRLSPFLLSLLSGFMLSAAWYWHLGILIFFAWVPLLLLEHQLSAHIDQPRRRLGLFFYSYLSFFIWNVLVTWWIVYASIGGACMAIFANAFLMAIVFLLFSALKKRIQSSWAIYLLIPMWLAWEYGHGLWDLSWTWLNLGNVFAFHHNWVQWFEYTGSSGGSFWVLLVNILVFQALQKQKLQFFSKTIAVIAAVILFPILISYLIYFNQHTFKRAGKSYKTLVVQPNIDPYNFKFVMEYQEQFFKFLNLVKGKIDEDTKYLVLPETFITDNINEAFINESQEIQWFRDSLLNKFPNLKIITGGNSYVFYENEAMNTATARKDQTSGKSYDVFNAAFFIDRNQVLIYHKSKLVPGVERMPFPALFKPLEKLALDLGGTIGSLGMQDERTVFADKENEIVIAPVICYESVYPDYVADYVRAGASIIFIVTNDGWWEDTPGYIQHLNYARLRAIENRRQIVRCANTGVSCFMDEFGNSTQHTNWWQEAVIEQKMYKNDALTFFSRFGDLLSYISIGISLLALLWGLWMRVTRKAFGPAAMAKKA